MQLDIPGRCCVLACFLGYLSHFSLFAGATSNDSVSGQVGRDWWDKAVHRFEDSETRKNLPAYPFAMFLGWNGDYDEAQKWLQAIEDQEIEPHGYKDIRHSRKAADFWAFLTWKGIPEPEISQLIPEHQYLFPEARLASLWLINHTLARGHLPERLFRTTMRYYHGSISRERLYGLSWEAFNALLFECMHPDRYDSALSLLYLARDDLTGGGFHMARTATAQGLFLHGQPELAYRALRVGGRLLVESVDDLFRIVDTIFPFRPDLADEILGRIERELRREREFVHFVALLRFLQTISRGDTIMAERALEDFPIETRSYAAARVATIHALAGNSSEFKRVYEEYIQVLERELKQEWDWFFSCFALAGHVDEGFRLLEEYEVLLGPEELALSAVQRFLAAGRVEEAVSMAELSTNPVFRYIIYSTVAKYASINNQGRILTDSVSRIMTLWSSDPDIDGVPYIVSALMFCDKPDELERIFVTAESRDSGIADFVVLWAALSQCAARFAGDGPG